MSECVWQALVELDEPLLPQLETLLVDKVPVVCEYVYDEFTSIYLTNGGAHEKQRAQELLGHLKYNLFVTTFACFVGYLSC